MFFKRFLLAIIFISTATAGVFLYLYFIKQQPALAQIVTEFYIDPDWTGVKSGTASQPWTTLDSAAWTTINNALNNGDVTVYFSAREASSDTGETYGGNLKLQRTLTSIYRLTVDGMSKWDTDDANPNWQTYSGNSKLKLSPSASIALGWDNTQQDNITIRGFEVSGSVARVMFAGDNLIVENIYSHDVTTNGATFQMAYSTNSSCVETFGKYSNVIIRNNYIENGYGESIYVGGTYYGGATQDCSAYGNSHSNILIENNTIINAGVNGAQGDGIDIKRGLTNVTIRGNTIVGARNLGITAAGVFSGNQNLIIENNKIYNSYNRGIQVGSSDSALANGVIIRNNLVYNNAGIGISITGNAPGSSNVNVYNNTVYGNTQVGLSYGYVNNSNSKNNLVFGNYNNGNQISFWGTNTNLVSDYNLYYPSIGYSSEGTNSKTISDSSGLLVNAVNGDFHLKSSSLAIDNGTDTGVIIDYDNVSRPQGSAWDIGAYEYIQASLPLKGDFNSDSKVNNLDFTSFKNAFKSIFNSIFDLNSDSAIDVKDLGVLMSGWLP